MSYEVAVRRNGFDSPKAKRFLLVADRAEMKIVAGHHHAVRSGIHCFFGEDWSFGNDVYLLKLQYGLCLSRMYFTMCSQLSISASCISFVLHTMALCVCARAPMC